MRNTSSKTKRGKVSKGADRKNTGRSGVVNGYVHGQTGKSGKAIAESLTPARIIEFIEDGLPIQELDDLQASLDVDMEKLASVLGISKATLHRRKAEGRLEPGESDRALRFARLLGKAVTVFGGIEKARQWLTSPQFGLSGAVPLAYAETELGAREVENLLGRIEYGVYS